MKYFWAAYFSAIIVFLVFTAIKTAKSYKRTMAILAELRAACEVAEEKAKQEAEEGHDASRWARKQFSTMLIKEDDCPGCGCEFYGDVQDFIIHLNDEDGLYFTDIADYLDQLEEPIIIGELEDLNG